MKQMWAHTCSRQWNPFNCLNNLPLMHSIAGAVVVGCAVLLVGANCAPPNPKKEVTKTEMATEFHPRPCVISSTADFASHVNQSVVIMGKARRMAKGMPVVELDSGDQIKVKLVDSNWSQATDGKRVEVVGRVESYRPSVNEAGYPVDAQGNFVQSYTGSEPVYFLTDCKWVIANY